MSLDDLVTLNSGARHQLALTRDGVVWVRGANDRGQLGLGDHADRPEWVVSHAGVRAVAAGPLHSLIVTEGGVLKVAGCNTESQLGLPGLRGRLAWTVALKGVVSAHADVGCSMVTLADGRRMVAGCNEHGRLGIHPAGPGVHYVRTWTAPRTTAANETGGRTVGISGAAIMGGAGFPATVAPAKRAVGM